MRIFAPRILKSWEYELARVPPLNTKFLTFSFLSPRVLSSQISRGRFYFLKKKTRPFFIFLPLHFIFLSKKQIKNNQMIDTTLNEYSYTCFFGYIFEVSEQSYEHGPGPVKRNRRKKSRRSKLVARKKNQSKNLRFPPQPWDRSHRHLRQ